MVRKIRDTEKRRLVESVDYLSRSKGRPVSSKDLRWFWSKQPDMYPILLQATGQLLIKAARMAPDGWGQIFRIGIIGNLAYYATDLNFSWRETLEVHRLRLGLENECRKEMPVLAQNLICTPHEKLARNALSGWYREWIEPLQTLPFLVNEFGDRLSSLKVVAEAYRSDNFEAVLLPKPISRERATKILRKEYTARLEWADTKRLSPNKHLVRLKHPRSGLIQSAGYRELEIQYYCRGRWPSHEDDQILAQSIFAVLAYGSGGCCFSAILKDRSGKQG